MRESCPFFNKNNRIEPWREFFYCPLGLRRLLFLLNLLLFDLFQVCVDGIVVALATLFITRPLAFRQIAASDVDVVEGFADRDSRPSGQAGHDVEGTGAFLEHELVPLLLCCERCLVTNSISILLTFHQSRIGVKKCDFNKRIVKVCVNCLWWRLAFRQT